MLPIQTKEFIPYKQHDRSSCVACVAAMITRTRPEDFVAFLVNTLPGEKIQPPYSDLYLAAYLLQFQMILGVGAAHISRDEKKVLIGEIVFDCTEAPAYVAVKSEDPKFEHALYWDGQRIWDPNPNSKDGRDPLSYSIVGWWPILSTRK